MFAELPKLFDRDFAVGFFLPLAFFGPFLYFVASSFRSPVVDELLKNVKLLQGKVDPFEATLLAILVWLVGILLLVMNRSIIRLKEGYGRWNPLRLLRWKEVSRYRRLQKAIDSLERRRLALEQSGLKLDVASSARRRILFLERSERFPQSEDFVLSTAFGNVIRAWEMYPLVMYGVDAISGWDRLIFLIPEKVRPLIDQDKAFMDFWLNVWLLNLIIFVEYAALVTLTHERGSLWSLLSLPLALLASFQARSAALGWGKSVKAAFDVYLPDLRKKLELRADLSPEDDREQWSQLGRAMLYRNPDHLPLRVAKDAGPPNGSGEGAAGD